MIQSWEKFVTNRWTEGCFQYKIPNYTERAMLFASFHFYTLRCKKKKKKKKVSKNSRHKYLSQRKPPCPPKYFKPPCITPPQMPTTLGFQPWVFRVLQYVNSLINIYPTATIILKFWVVLEQTFCKKRIQKNFLWPENSYNLIYPRWLDGNITFRHIPHQIPKWFLGLRQCVFTPSAVWLQKYRKF